MKPDLDAIRARCDAATPGPWRVDGSTYDEDCNEHLAPYGLEGPNERLIWSSGGGEYAHPDMDTAQFIAAARTDVPALLAYIDELERQRNVERERADDLMSRLICHEDAQDDICEDITHLRRANASLEHMLGEERENVDTLRARVAELEAEVAVLRPWSVMLKRAHGALTDAGCVVPLEFDQSIEHAINDLARRATRAEQLYVDEYDAHQETRKLLTDLYMKQLRADAAQMREYGISYDGLRQLLAEYDGGDLSLGKVLDLFRAAARELAKEEVAELKARITTLEAMR